VEELIKVQHEMLWTVCGFRARAAQWASHMEASNKPGAQAYAAKQQALWSSFADQAKTRFMEALTKILSPTPSWIEKIDFISL
jgi:hypothetical protein